MLMVEKGGAWLDSQETTIININKKKKNMLRFRPIAPKPALGGTLSVGSVMSKANGSISKRRTKRKYVRVRKNSNRDNERRNNNISVTNEEAEDMSVMTLQLFPDEFTDRHDNASNGGSWFGKFDLAVNKNRDEEEEDGNRFLKLNFPSDHRIDLFYSESKSLDRTVVISQNMKVVVEVRVTVECVTETLCMDVRELGFTDIERTRNLDEDPCPGFISDGANRVQWVNGAFRRMVFGLKNLRQLPEMVVWLVMREKLVYGAFSCRVKLEYIWEKEKYSQVVPCDVWRMDCGGFAWRLDLKAALSLGR